MKALQPKLDALFKGHDALFKRLGEVREALKGHGQEDSKNSYWVTEVNDEDIININWVQTPRENYGATLDSGAPATVAGKAWLKGYLEANNILENTQQKHSSTEVFCFGPGPQIPAMEKVELPVKLIDKFGEEKLVVIGVCIVDADIPLLLGGDYHDEFNIVTIP